MKLTERVDYITRDIRRQAEALEAYREVERIFNGIDFSMDHSTYAWKSIVDGSYHVEFSPGYEDNSKVGLQSLVHAIARKFHVKFDRNPNYDNSAIEYSANFVTRFDNRDQTMFVKISGVLPKTCKVEEIETPLSDEEIEANRLEALANVKTVRVERKITCK